MTALWAGSRRPCSSPGRGILTGSPGPVCFVSTRAADLATRRFGREEAVVRSNKVTLIWGILTLISLLALLVLVVLGVVSI